MSLRLSILVLGLFFVAGCPKKSEAVSDAAPVAATASAAPSAVVEEDAAPATTAKVDTEWLPSHTDDDTKAKKEITKANYKQELDTLDKEISSEK